jgi:hypothetical protein
MGTIKTTNIEPIADNGTVTLGSSGDTFTVPSGVTVNMSSATQTGVGGVNTPAFEAILSSATTINHDTATKVQCNTEIFDTAGAYDNSTNFRFTPQVAGKYFVYAKVRIDSSPGNCEVVVSYIYKNGSNYTFSLIDFDNNDGEGGTTNQASVIDFNGSSDYVELYAYGKNASGSGTLNLEGASSGYPTVFGAYKIIE